MTTLTHTLLIVFCAILSSNAFSEQKISLENSFLTNHEANIEPILLAQTYKTRKSGQSAKEAASDIPSWATGEKPFVGESGTQFAKRLLKKKYPSGGYPTGPGSEYNKIKKYGDRAFE